MLKTCYSLIDLLTDKEIITCIQEALKDLLGGTIREILEAGMDEHKL